MVQAWYKSVLGKLVLITENKTVQNILHKSISSHYDLNIWTCGGVLNVEPLSPFPENDQSGMTTWDQKTRMLGD